MYFIFCRVELRVLIEETLYLSSLIVRTTLIISFIITSISRITTEVRDEGIPDCNLGYYDSFDLLIIFKLGNSVLDDHFQSFCN